MKLVIRHLKQELSHAVNSVARDEKFIAKSQSDLVVNRLKKCRALIPQLEKAIEILQNHKS